MSVGTKMVIIIEDVKRSADTQCWRDLAAIRLYPNRVEFAATDHRLTLPRIHSALEPFYREAHRLTPPARTTQFRRLFAFNAAKYLRTGIIGRNGPMGGPNAGKRTPIDQR